MKFLIIAALLSFIPAQTVDRRIALIFVEPSGESFTPEEQQQAIQNATDAAQYWMELSPITTTVQIISTQFITTTEDVLSDPNRAMQSPAVHFNADELPLIVIDNTESRRVLFDMALGLASYASIYVVTSANADTYAHEMGHAFYNLPHQYQADYDIMSLYPPAAYQRHMIGCASLEVLGRPCGRIFLPIIKMNG